MRMSVRIRLIITATLTAFVLTLSIISGHKYPVFNEELGHIVFQYALLGLSLLPFILFSLKNRTSLILGVAFPMLSLILYNPLHQWLNCNFDLGETGILMHPYLRYITILTCLALVGVAYLLRRKFEAMAYQNRFFVRKSYTSQRTISETSQDNENLARHNSELSQFLYAISHNSRGPISNLKGLLNLMELDGMKAENIDIVSKLSKTVSYLDENIKDLTYIIDIQNNTTQVYRYISLQEEIDHIRTVLERQIDHDEVTIKVNFDKIDHIYSVRSLLRSILINIVSNGIKYKSPKREAKILISAEQIDDQMCIKIEDNGLGIDLSRHRHQLFELYKRFSSTDIEGKGIGLFLIKLQMDMLKGKIEVNSKLGEGTCFNLYFPIPKNIEKQYIFENDAGTIYFNSRLNCLKTNWKKNASSENVSAMRQKVNEMANIYQADKWIFNLDHPIDQCLNFITGDGVNRINYFIGVESPLELLIVLMHGQDKTKFHELKKEFESVFNLKVKCFDSEDQASEYIKEQSQSSL